MKTSMFSKFFRCIWFYSRSVHWTLLERSMVALEVNTYQPYMRRLSKQFDIWGKRFFSNGSLSQHSSLSLLLLHIQARTYFFLVNQYKLGNRRKLIGGENPPPRAPSTLSRANLTTNSGCYRFKRKLELLKNLSKVVLAVKNWTY